MDDLIYRNRLIESMNFNGGCGICFEYVLEADSVEAVPLEPLCGWLAAYAVPPQYAMNSVAGDPIAPTSCVYPVNRRMEAWKYHFRELLKSGLMDTEEINAEK